MNDFLSELIRLLIRGTIGWAVATAIAFGLVALIHPGGTWAFLIGLGFGYVGFFAGIALVVE